MGLFKKLTGTVFGVPFTNRFDSFGEPSTEEVYYSLHAGKLTLIRDIQLQMIPKLTIKEYANISAENLYAIDEFIDTYDNTCVYQNAWVNPLDPDNMLIVCFETLKK